MRGVVPFIVLIAAIVAPPSSARAQDFNADRPGGDFASVTLGQGASPYDCERLCNADGRCQAYVKAGVQDQIAVLVEEQCAKKLCHRPEILQLAVQYQFARW